MVVNNIKSIAYFDKQHENAYWEKSETKKGKIYRHPFPCPSSVVYLPAWKNNMQFKKKNAQLLT